VVLLPAVFCASGPGPSNMFAGGRSFNRASRIFKALGAFFCNSLPRLRTRRSRRARPLPRAYPCRYRASFFARPGEAVPVAALQRGRFIRNRYHVPVIQDNDGILHGVVLLLGEFCASGRGPSNAFGGTLQFRLRIALLQRFRRLFLQADKRGKSPGASVGAGADCASLLSTATAEIEALRAGRSRRPRLQRPRDPQSHSMPRRGVETDLASPPGVAISAVGTALHVVNYMSNTVTKLRFGELSMRTSDRRHLRRCHRR
jgi:hypothetical protein